MNVRFWVEGKERVDLGTLPEGSELPLFGEMVKLQGVPYRVKGRHWSYDWQSEAGPICNLDKRVEIELVRWALP